MIARFKGCETGEPVTLLSIALASTPNSDSGPLTITFWVTAVVGAIIGVVVTRTADRWFQQLGDYELWIDFTATPLFINHPQSTSKNFAYMVDGVTTSRPYQVQLWVWRAGTKDVRADSFSDDLIVRLGVPIVESTLRSDEQAGATKVLFSAGEDPTWVVNPSIIAADFIAHYDFVSDGLPSLEIMSRVVDLRIASFYDEAENRNTRSTVLAAIGAVLLPGGLIWTIVGSIIYRNNNDFGQWFALGIPPMFIGIFALGAVSAVIPRRARLARGVLRQRTGRRFLLPRNQIELPDNLFSFRESEN